MPHLIEERGDLFGNTDELLLGCVAGSDGIREDLDGLTDFFDSFLDFIELVRLEQVDSLPDVVENQLRVSDAVLDGVQRDLRLERQSLDDALQN